MATKAIEARRTIRKRPRALWQRAVAASHAAKRSDQASNNQAIFYRQKGWYLSALRRMGCLYIYDAAVAPSGIVLDVRFGRARIHIFVHELDADVQKEIQPVVARLLRGKEEKFER